MQATPDQPRRAPASHVGAFVISASAGGSSGAEQGLDRAALVHGLIALGGLIERQLEVEDLPGLIACSRSGRSARAGSGAPARAAVQVDVGEEQLLAGQFYAMADADVPDVAAGARGADRLQHRLLGADRLDDRVAPSLGQLLDPRHALVAALGDDVGGAEFAGQLLARLVPAHRDDPLGTELPCREHPSRHRAVADDRDRLAGSARRRRAEPTGAEHIGGGQQARDQVLLRQPGVRPACRPRAAPAGTRPGRPPHRRTPRARSGSEPARQIGQVLSEAKTSRRRNRRP